MPALRQQEHRAALCLLRSHIQKERVEPASRSSRMRSDKFSCGSLEIDGSSYEHDVLIDRGEISQRRKKRPKKLRELLAHTPLPLEENLPWHGRQLLSRYGASATSPR